MAELFLDILLIYFGCFAGRRACHLHRNTLVGEDARLWDAIM